MKFVKGEDMHNPNTLKDIGAKVKDALDYARTCCNGEGDDPLLEMIDACEKTFNDGVVNIIRLAVELRSLRFRPAQEVRDKLVKIMSTLTLMQEISARKSLSPNVESVQ